MGGDGGPCLRQGALKYRGFSSFPPIRCQPVCIFKRALFAPGAGYGEPLQRLLKATGAEFAAVPHWHNAPISGARGAVPTKIIPARRLFVSVLLRFCRGD